MQLNADLDAGVLLGRELGELGPVRNDAIPSIAGRGRPPDTAASHRRRIPRRGRPRSRRSARHRDDGVVPSAPANRTARRNAASCSSAIVLSGMQRVTPHVQCIELDAVARQLVQPGLAGRRVGKQFVGVKVGMRRVAARADLDGGDFLHLGTQPGQRLSSDSPRNASSTTETSHCLHGRVASSRFSSSW